jgi:hypothetical protein
MTPSFKSNRALWNCWLHCRPISIELLPLDLSVESSVPVSQSVQCSLIPAKPSHPMRMLPVLTQSYRSNYRHCPVVLNSVPFFVPCAVSLGSFRYLFYGPFLWSGVRVSELTFPVSLRISPVALSLMLHTIHSYNLYGIFCSSLTTACGHLRVGHVEPLHVPHPWRLSYSLCCAYWHFQWSWQRVVSCWNDWSIIRWNGSSLKLS